MKDRYDLSLFILVLFLIIWGVVNIYSASFHEYPNLYIKQAVFGAVGVLLIIALSFINYRKLVQFAPVLYFFGVVSLIVVMFSGTTILGAKRWINLGFFNVQPSEFMKFVIIVMTAYLLGLRKEKPDLKMTFIVLLIAGIPFVLTMKQPDLGTAVTLLIPVFAVLFVAGIDRKYIIAFFVSVGLLSPFMWDHLKDYQKKRILAFINPEADPFKSAYHLLQSKIAIGSGKLTGKGFLEGTQSKLFFLPEQHTDFIFSTIGEEWGFVVSSIIVFLYFLLGLRILYWAKKVKDVEGKYICIGAGSLITIQAFINIAMTVGLAPVVGITLPFLSYGGSSLITFCLIIGIVMSVIRINKQEKLSFG